MTPDSSDLLWAAGATTVLLGLGAWAGYYAGTQASIGRSRTVSPEATSHSPTYWSLLENIDRCATHGFKVAKQGSDLVSLGRAQAVPLGTELSAAIERLSATTHNLANGLREMQTAARAAKSAKHGSNQPGSAVVPRAAESHDATLLRRRAGASAPEVSLSLRGISPSALTSDEICELTGAHAATMIEDSHKQRHPYDCFQQLAPCYDPAAVPSPAQMVRVRCHDISVEGISFFWPQQPDFDMATISLGDGNVLMSIEVRQSKAVFMHDEVQYLVGCRFLKRVNSTGAKESSAAGQCVTA